MKLDLFLYRKEQKVKFMDPDVIPAAILFLFALHIVSDGTGEIDCVSDRSDYIARTVLQRNLPDVGETGYFQGHVYLWNRERSIRLLYASVFYIGILTNI